MLQEEKHTVRQFFLGVVTSQEDKHILSYSSVLRCHRKASTQSDSYSGVVVSQEHKAHSSSLRMAVHHKTNGTPCFWNSLSRVTTWMADARITITL